MVGDDIEGDHPVRTEGLRKVYGDIVAVDRLDLKVAKGQIYGLIGPNGSGKTTTIKVLMGRLKATEGRAWLLGEQIPLKENVHRVSYMPQELALYSDLTVHENLQLFSDLYGCDRSLFAEREKALLDMVDLAKRKHSLVNHLSGGMQHRTSLACALINDPELVFLDEPTVGVDPELRAGFWTYFQELKSRGKTIILTTHYMDEASRCDTVGMMHLGKLLAEGVPGKLLAETRKSNLEDAFLEYIRRCRA